MYFTLSACLLFILYKLRKILKGILITQSPLL